MTDLPKTLDTHRIVGAEEPGATPADRRPWRRLGIYRSPICLAVNLTPCIDHWTEKTREDAKSKLFRYLRRLYQAALEHGVICPLAAVIEIDNGSSGLARDIHPWGSDQGWHRGGFTLYVESGQGTGKRLEDLLNPRVEYLMDLQKQEARDAQWYADQLGKTLKNGADGTDNARALTHELLERCRDRLVDSKDYKDAGDKVPSLTEWYRSLVDQARRLSEQESLS